MTPNIHRFLTAACLTAVTVTAQQHEQVEVVVETKPEAEAAEAPRSTLLPLVERLDRKLPAGRVILQGEQGKPAAVHIVGRSANGEISRIEASEVDLLVDGEHLEVHVPQGVGSVATGQNIVGRIANTPADVVVEGVPVRDLSKGIAQDPRVMRYSAVTVPNGQGGQNVFYGRVLPSEEGASDEEEIVVLGVQDPGQGPGKKDIEALRRRYEEAKKALQEAKRVHGEAKKRDAKARKVKARVTKRPAPAVERVDSAEVRWHTAAPEAAESKPRRVFWATEVEEGASDAPKVRRNRVFRVPHAKKGEDGQVWVTTLSPDFPKPPHAPKAPKPTQAPKPGQAPNAPNAPKVFWRTPKVESTEHGQFRVQLETPESGGTFVFETPEAEFEVAEVPHVAEYEFTEEPVEVDVEVVEAPNMVEFRVHDEHGHEHGHEHVEHGEVRAMIEQMRAEMRELRDMLREIRSELRGQARRPGATSARNQPRYRVRERFRAPRAVRVRERKDR